MPFLNIYHPERFHGFNVRPPYFEGWFYKIVTADKSEVFAFIPGVFLDKDPARSHSFIQVLDGHHRATYHRFPVSSFSAEKDQFSVRIGESHFDWEQCSIVLNSEGRTIKGTVNLHGVTPWPVSALSPGIMGPFGLLPFMQCYHGVPSLYHTLSGSLSVDGREINFDGGIGYLEKDWGSGFPEAYVWMQCNHFETPRMCLSASVAKIPFPTGTFRGFIIGLLLPDGRLQKWTTYSGARLYNVEITDTTVAFEVADRHFRMIVAAERTEGGLLHAPYARDMIQKISETLRSTLRIQVWEKGRLLFEETGEVAGLDVNGDSAWVTD
ncbi:MAG: hypothetical protein JNN12_07840 [Bacteroidetes Order II. Incertae sedis bacterium]|nr:hypothetical protein [Bacteroidetes Order II. bacterium]